MIWRYKFERQHGRTHALRVTLATTLGPLIPALWYVAPKWKRDKWHRIACNDDNCASCERYYSHLAGIL